MSWPLNNGYTCGGCGAWVQYGTMHSCVSYPTPAPAPIPFMIQPGVSEERVREIVREELAREQTDQPTDSPTSGPA